MHHPLFKIQKLCSLGINSEGTEHFYNASFREHFVYNVDYKKFLNFNTTKIWLWRNTTRKPGIHRPVKRWKIEQNIIKYFNPKELKGLSKYQMCRTIFRRHKKVYPLKKIGPILLSFRDLLTERRSLVSPFPVLFMFNSSIARLFIPIVDCSRGWRLLV